MSLIDEIKSRPQMSEEEVRAFVDEHEDLSEDEWDALFAFHVPTSALYQLREFEEAKREFIAAVKERLRSIGEAWEQVIRLALNVRKR